MKSLFTLMTVAAVVSASSAFADVDPRTPTFVHSEYHTGYIPDGFDSNDNVQLVGEGMFSNTCYRPGKVETAIDHANKRVYVQPSAYKYDGMCLQVVVPFHQVVNLGLMKVGDYKVVQSRINGELGALKIRAATNSDADDFLYAPISQAYMSSRDGNVKVKLSGVFSNSCLSLADVMVDVQSNVIAVQPISELDERADCADGEFPFEHTLEIDNVSEGRYLLHVRSLNGKAINNLVDVK